MLATLLMQQGHLSLAQRPKEMNMVCEIVQEAPKIGLKTANAGVACGQVDAVCRNLIAERGYRNCSSIQPVMA